MTIFDKTDTLNNGVKIPRFALGVWEIANDQTAKAVTDAIDLGYRHIDTAQAYHNESGVGDGVRASNVPRDQIFLNSKIKAELKTYNEAKKSIDESLGKMKLDYLDMMIIHNPQPWNEVNKTDDRHFEGNLEAWRALEDAMKEGKLRAIGVSSFQRIDLDNIIRNSSTKPMVNQILCHIGATPLDLIEYSQKNGIIVESFSPIAHGEIMRDPAIKSIADKYNVSIPQLAIRYCWQLNTVVLPKSANPEHMKFNAQIDFEISTEDMKFLESIKSIDYGDSSKYPVFGGSL